MSIDEYQPAAEHLLRQTGSRVTRGRVVVLASLLDARRALTHSEVEARIERLYDIDRVTVYRVLDWLTQLGLAHRISGDDRVWRFTAESEAHSGTHAHFKCNACGDVICLDETVGLPEIPLPPGYRSAEFELTVKGLCASCAPRPHGALSRKLRAGGRSGKR
jgi:Fur family ferric uptake transcriptional regulator